MTDLPELTIQCVPVEPFGLEWDYDAVQGVWDTYIKPNQDAGMPQSIEERILMAILRSVATGFEANV